MSQEPMAIKPRVVRCVGIRTLRFRSVLLVLHKELLVRRWMKIFVAREFFVDEIRDPRTRPIQVRLLQQKLVQREWLFVLTLKLDARILRVA